MQPKKINMYDLERDFDTMYAYVNRIVTDVRQLNAFLQNTDIELDSVRTEQLLPQLQGMLKQAHDYIEIKRREKNNVAK